MPMALVTGANRGIGKEVARQLAARGFEVFLGARDAEAGQRAAEEVGGEWLALDLADPLSIRDAGAFLAERGPLDLLVNNAGVLLDEGRPLMELGEETLLATLYTNAVGPLLLAQACAPSMPKGGRIVNVSSGGGQLSSPPGWVAPAYCISKTALNAVTVQLAEALRPRGIAVNAVCPGWVRTDMGGPGASLSVEQGADTIVWLGTEAPHELSGGFYRGRKSIPW